MYPSPLLRKKRTSTPAARKLDAPKCCARAPRCWDHASKVEVLLCIVRHVAPTLCLWELVLKLWVLGCRSECWVFCTCSAHDVGCLARLLRQSPLGAPCPPLNSNPPLTQPASQTATNPPTSHLPNQKCHTSSRQNYFIVFSATSYSLLRSYISHMALMLIPMVSEFLISGIHFLTLVFI